MGDVTWQKFLAHWKQFNNQLLKHVQMVIQADDSLRARMKHLSQYEIKGPHTRFDIPADKSVRFSPTKFLGNILSMTKAKFSAAGTLPTPYSRTGFSSTTNLRWEIFLWEGN